MTLPVEKKHRHTISDYLRLERDSDEKHEYRDGEIIAMAAGTYNHSVIKLNVYGELRNRLRGGPCQPLESDMPLEEYVLVSQDTPCVETFFPQEGGTWLFSAFSGLEAHARFRSLNIDVPLAEIYLGVTFPPQEESQTALPAS